MPGIAGKCPEGEEYDDLYGTYTEGCEGVREAQRHVAEKLADVYLVPSGDLYPLEDPVHWGFEAYRSVWGREWPRLRRRRCTSFRGMASHQVAIY